MSTDEMLTFLFLKGWTQHQWESWNDMVRFITVERNNFSLPNIDLDDSYSYVNGWFIILVDPSREVPLFSDFYSVKKAFNKVTGDVC